MEVSRVQEAERAGVEDERKCEAQDLDNDLVCENYGASQLQASRTFPRMLMLETEQDVRTFSLDVLDVHALMLAILRSGRFEQIRPRRLKPRPLVCLPWILT